MANGYPLWQLFNKPYNGRMSGIPKIAFADMRAHIGFGVSLVAEQDSITIIFREGRRVIL